MADTVITQSATAPARRVGKSIKLEHIIDHAVLIFGVLLMIVPMLVVLQMTTVPDAEISKTGPGLTIGNQFMPNLEAALFEASGFSGEQTGLRMFKNSLILGLGFAIGKIIISMMAARTSWRCSPCCPRSSRDFLPKLVRQGPDGIR